MDKEFKVVIKDRCKCRATIEISAIDSHSAAYRHDAWIEAHAVCRQPETLLNQKSDGGDNPPMSDIDDLEPFNFDDHYRAD